MSETKKLPQYLQLIVNIFSQGLVFLNLLLFQLVLLKILLKVFSLICPLLGSLVIGSSSDSSVIVSSIGSLVYIRFSLGFLVIESSLGFSVIGSSLEFSVMSSFGSTVIASSLGRAVGSFFIFYGGGLRTNASHHG